MKTGFTLVELLASIGIALVLSAAAVAVMGRATEQARAVQCAGNLRQWGTALQFYLHDSGGMIPRRGQGVQPVWVVDREEDWFNCLPPYLEMQPYSKLYQAGRAPKPGGRSVFVCPSARTTNAHTHFITYGMNMYLSRWDQAERTWMVNVSSPSTLAFLADSPGGYASTVPSSREYSVTARHLGNANVLFLDGHVQSFPKDYLGCGTGEKKQPDIRWQTGADGDIWRPLF